MGNCVAVVQACVCRRSPINIVAVVERARPDVVVGPELAMPPKLAMPVGEVLGRQMEDINAVYVMGRQLGRGEFGVTHECMHRRTGRRFACKSISKLRLVTREDADDVRREIAILHHVSGTHPNIVNLEAAFEDLRHVHLVMELCEGGELFDRILRDRKLSERSAAELCRTMASVVAACCSLRVIHRDLKPENFLFLSPHDTSPLKAIDFGLSTFYKPGETYTDIVGTPLYMAPEVIQSSYGPECDVWSIGIILYILLSGMPPFYAESEEGIMKAVVKNRLDLQCDPWPSISEPAKDLVEKMLTKDPRHRITATDILNHSWIRADGEVPDVPLDNIVLQRMKQFTAMNKLKRLALKVIAQSLTKEEIQGLKELFESMDTDHSGTITYAELKRGLAMQGADLPESEVQQLMESADADGNGLIDYMEFITATMNMSKMEQEDRLLMAFRHFDRDHSGYITASKLEEALAEHNMGNGEAIKDIIAEVDTDNDGQINYDEFVAMMRKGLPHQKRRRHGHIKDAQN